MTQFWSPSGAVDWSVSTVMLVRFPVFFSTVQLATTSPERVGSWASAAS